MRTCSILLFLFLFASPSAWPQWAQPQPIDSITVPQWLGSTVTSIAIGPQREVAIVPRRGDTLLCYFSRDNGRRFLRSVIAHERTFGFLHETIGPVDGVVFDSHSNLFVFWRLMTTEEYVGWYSFVISKSTDGGRTFSLFWSSRTFGGLTSSSLVKTSLVIDANDRLHLLWDSTGWDYGYIYTQFAAADSSITQQTVLPTLPASGYAASSSLLVGGEFVHVALSAMYRAYPRAALYYLRSTNSGATFSTVIPVDTLNARFPALIRDPSGQVSLVYAVGPISAPQSYDDTALVARQFLDSTFSPPVLLLSAVGGSMTPKVVRSVGSGFAVAHTRYSQVYGTSYYQFDQIGGTITDSLFLPGHHSPDFAVDSLGGKYLATVYQNHVYLTTKDVVLGISEQQASAPLAFDLSQNYPNPFNPTTTIKFQIPRQTDGGQASTSFVTLRVFDMLGREVAALANEEMKPGSYERVFNGEGLASGVYFYRLQARQINGGQAGSFVQTRKLVLLR